MQSDTDPKKPFLSHVSELRKRLLFCLLALFICSFLGYLIHKELIDILSAPLYKNLYYTSPGGGLSFTLTVSIFFGFLASMPVFIYNILGFLFPIVPKKSKKMLLLAFFNSLILMFAGILFAYFISLPTALHFLSEFESENIQALISVNEYFSFVIRYVLGFGVLFQIPLVLVFFNEVSPISENFMYRSQKWAILVCVVVAAIITPTPDVVNMLFMALPMLTLYEISLIIILIINLRRKKY